MGALRRPEHPSVSLDPPHLVLTLGDTPSPLGWVFAGGVGTALLGALLMLAGTALASVPLVGLAVGSLLIASVALRSRL